MSHPALDAFGDLTQAAHDPHVASCPQCQTELATQQQIHDLLTSLPDPGPIPPEVVHRIEATLSELARGDHSPESSSVSSSVSHPTASPDGVATEPADAPGTSAATVVPLQSAPTARRRRRPLLAVAAAAVVLVGGGAVVSQLVANNTSTDSSAGASASMQDKSAEDLASGAAVQPRASGTDYTRAKLADQVRSTMAGAPAPSAVAPQGLLSTPKGVAGCLSALGASGVQPLLVDVATFEGKPAAVLVLPGDGGSQEIWVVSTTCKPSSDGMKYFLTVH